MADSKKDLAREQNEASANSIRELVKRHKVRGGMTERDAQSFLDDLEGIAKGLEDRGKTEDELAQEREEQGLPNPSKTAAELVLETQERDKESEAEKKKEAAIASSPSASTAPPSAIDRRLGIPAVTAQASTTARERQESTVKTALDSAKSGASAKK